MCCLPYHCVHMLTLCLEQVIARISTTASLASLAIKKSMLVRLHFPSSMRRLAIHARVCACTCGSVTPGVGGHGARDPSELPGEARGQASPGAAQGCRDQEQRQPTVRLFGDGCCVRAGDIPMLFAVYVSYATTAVSSFLLKQIAKRVGVPMQEFVVRQDMGCGSTIGPILATVRRRGGEGLR